MVVRRLRRRSGSRMLMAGLMRSSLPWRDIAGRSAMERSWGRRGVIGGVLLTGLFCSIAFGESDIGLIVWVAYGMAPAWIEGQTKAMWVVHKALWLSTKRG